MIRKYKNAFLRFYRIYTEMALPESYASAYSAISAYLVLFAGSRARVTLAVSEIFYGLERRKIPTAAPLPCSLYLPTAALTGKLPIPPYPHIKYLSSKFYTARTTEAEPVFQINPTHSLIPTNNYYTYFR